MSKKLIGLWDIQKLLKQGLSIDEISKHIAEEMNESIEESKE
jgi:hypothetical protein